jgi:6-phosphogluconolactonase
VSAAKLEVVEDPARACAALLTELARAGGQLALAGGSTPRAAYELAAADGEAWATATIWFGDERCVPPEDPSSNYRMVKEALLDRVGGGLGGVAGPAVHRMRGELGPAAGAEEYEAELRDAGSPRLDLVLLGLGPDGHTLSLFPDQPALSERSRWVIGVEQAAHEPFVPRISLTFAALAAAKRVVFLVDSAAKAPAVAAAFGPDARPDPHIPASLVAEIADDVTVLLDPAAAASTSASASDASR